MAEPGAGERSERGRHEGSPTTSGASPTRCSTSPEPSTPSARPKSYSKLNQTPRKVRLSGSFCFGYVFRRSGGAVRKTAQMQALSLVLCLAITETTCYDNNIRLRAFPGGLHETPAGIKGKRGQNHEKNVGYAACAGDGGFPLRVRRRQQRFRRRLERGNSEGRRRGPHQPGRGGVQRRPRADGGREVRGGHRRLHCP